MTSRSLTTAFRSWSTGGPRGSGGRQGEEPGRPAGRARAREAYRVGRALIELHRAKVERGEDWSVRLNSSFCSGEMFVIATVYQRTKAGGLLYVPTVVRTLEEALEWAGRQG